jgi:uncharacterized protein YqgV (UPF0045/DUF77 family)
MEVACQFSIYPLAQTELSPAIDAAVAEIRKRGLDVDTGPMSSLAYGPVDGIFAALADAFKAAATGGCVLVATVSNACPIPPRE